MKRVTLLLFIILLINTFVHAQEDTSLTDEFMSDTARVEQLIRDMLDKDYSTMGMITAAIELGEEYDKLLNKYYKKLYNLLGSEAKAALKKAQQDWIKFRDSELDLISGLRTDTYERMGGGTMWGVVAASSRAQVTKQRVIDLYNYMRDFYY